MKFRALFAFTGLILSASLIACGPPPNKNVAKKVGKDDTISSSSPTALSEVEFVESARGGDPGVVGCADGQREGFADLAEFPDIAGCLALWDSDANLRKGKIGTACGDDLEVCSSPADVCAEGWHVCARNGDYHDLTDRLSDKQCSEGAGPGKFVAAISHVKKKKECAPAPGPNTRYPCLKNGYGAEPVCCGTGCRSGECKDAVWPGKTRISVGKAEGCANVSSDRNGGIMCCKDSGEPEPQPRPPVVTPLIEAPPEATAQPTEDPTGPEPSAKDAAAAPEKSPG